MTAPQGMSEEELATIWKATICLALELVEDVYRDYAPRIFALLAAYRALTAERERLQGDLTSAKGSEQSATFLELPANVEPATIANPITVVMPAKVKGASMSAPQGMSQYADLLNDLDAMQQSMAYAVRRPVLASAERTIVSLEKERDQLAERVKELERIQFDHALNFAAAQEYIEALKAQLAEAKDVETRYLGIVMQKEAHIIDLEQTLTTAKALLMLHLNQSPDRTLAEAIERFLGPTTDADVVAARKVVEEP